MSNPTSNPPRPNRDGDVAADKGSRPGGSRYDMTPAPGSRGGIHEVERLLHEARTLAQQTVDESMTRAEAVFAKRWSDLRDPLLAAIRHTISDYSGVVEVATEVRRHLVRFESAIDTPTPSLKSSDTPSTPPTSTPPALTPQIPAPRTPTSRTPTPQTPVPRTPAPQTSTTPTPTPQTRSEVSEPQSPASPGVATELQQPAATPVPPNLWSRLRAHSDAADALPAATAPDGAQADITESGKPALHRRAAAQLLRAWRRPDRRLTRWAVAAGLSLLVALPLAYGWWRERATAAGETGRQLRVQYIVPFSSSRAAAGDTVLRDGSDASPRLSSGAEVESGRPLEPSTPGSGEEARSNAAPNTSPRVGAVTTGLSSNISVPSTALDEPATLVTTTPETPAPVTTSPESPTTTLDDDAPAEGEAVAVPSQADLSARAVELTRVDADPATDSLLENIELSAVAPPSPRTGPATGIAAEEALPEYPAGAPPPQATESPTPVAPQPAQLEPVPTPPPPVESAEAETTEPRAPAESRTPRRGALVSLTDEGVLPPQRTVEPQPVYPRPALHLRREATVTLRVLVDENGRPQQIERMGAEAGLGFDDAARKAVEHARWRPATQDGVPVKVWIQTNVAFRLDGR